MICCCMYIFRCWTCDGSVEGVKVYIPISIDWARKKGEGVLGRTTTRSFQLSRIRVNMGWRNNS